MQCSRQKRHASRRQRDVSGSDCSAFSRSRTAVRFAKLVQTTLSTCRVAVYSNVDPTAVCVSCARKSFILRGTEPEQLRAHFEAARVVLWGFARHTVYAQL